jgi:hypothetical protein
VTVIDHSGKQFAPPDFPAPGPWRELDLVSFANSNLILFPGQLFRADYARALGGFRPTSLFAGDWEMWFKLSAAYGSGQTRQPVAFVRSHLGAERGTRRVERCGKIAILDNVQRKRNLAILKRMGYKLQFHREPHKSSWPLPSRPLIQHASGFSPRILAYNARLFLQSRPPNWRYALLQSAVRLTGARFLRILSRFPRLRKWME